MTYEQLDQWLYKSGIEKFIFSLPLDTIIFILALLLGLACYVNYVMFEWADRLENNFIRICSGLLFFAAAFPFSIVVLIIYVMNGRPGNKTRIENLKEGN